MILPFLLCCVITFASSGNCGLKGERTNLAFLKPTSQSSDYYVIQGHAEVAVDGIMNSVFYDCLTCTNTQEESNPWWMVDLGEEFIIQEVVLTNRYEVPERLRNFVIQISKTKSGNSLINPIVCATRVPSLGPGETVSFPCIGGDTLGRYVRITLQSYEFLSLCEVKIYGPYIDLSNEFGGPACKEDFDLDRTGFVPQIPPLLVASTASKMKCGHLCSRTKTCVSFTFSKNKACGLYSCHAFHFDDVRNTNLSDIRHYVLRAIRRLVDP